MLVRQLALCVPLLVLATTLAGQPPAGLRLRNAMASRVQVEVRVAGGGISCADGARFRTYRLNPGQVWIIPPQGGGALCWRWRADADGRPFTDWERVDPATEAARDLAVAP